MLNFVAKVYGSENAGHLEQILWPHILIQFYITLSTICKSSEFTGKVGTLETCPITLHLLALSPWTSHFNIMEAWFPPLNTWDCSVCPCFSLSHTHIPAHPHTPIQSCCKEKKSPQTCWLKNNTNLFILQFCKLEISPESHWAIYQSVTIWLCSFWGF